jgi:hypothetical protein
LFEKIEKIVNRRGPFKLQQSKNNPGKLAKVYYPPSDQQMEQALYI